MKSYEPRECPICGVKFVPRRFDQVSCGAPDCKRRWKNRDMVERNAIRRREKRTSEPRKRKKDTIVAIGYADRQMAATLAKVPKIDTTL